jgi:LTXXQ motif family protein
MNRYTYKVVFRITPMVVAMLFLSAAFFANVNPSLATTVNKKSPTVARTSVVDRTEARIKQLQGALKITDAQKELWNNLLQVMRENAKDMDVFIKERTGKNRTMNAVERMKFHSEITETHLNQLKKFIPPFEALYAGMSEGQKKTTDALFRKGISRKSKGK